MGNIWIWKRTDSSVMSFGVAHLAPKVNSDHGYYQIRFAFLLETVLEADPSGRALLKVDVFYPTAAIRPGPIPPSRQAPARSWSGRACSGRISSANYCQTERHRAHHGRLSELITLRLRIPSGDIYILFIPRLFS